MMEDNFHNLTSSDELKFVKHNPTNFDHFKKFQNRLNKQFEEFENEKEKKEIIAHLKKWEEMLPPRWSKALLTKINPPADKAANKIIEILENEYKPSVFIQGQSGSGKTYLAHATIRRCLGKNWITPAQIKIISEETLLGFASSGFEGQARFNEILKPRFQLYLFDGLGSRTSYTQKESQLWEQIIDHIYNKSLMCLFTSTESPEHFASFLSDSAESKLAHLIDGKIIEVKRNGERPKLTKNNSSEERDLYESGLFKE